MSPPKPKDLGYPASGRKRAKSTFTRRQGTGFYAEGARTGQLIGVCYA